MKNIKLLIITLLFSSLLIGCGMKGPLYRAPVAQPAPVVKSTETTEASQDTSATAANKQQVVTEQEKSDKTTENE